MKEEKREGSFSGSYFIVQMKRMLRLLPAVAGVTAVMGCAALLLTGVLSRAADSEEKPKYVLGLVGDVSDSYLGFGISALTSLDDSRFMLDLIQLTEDEARRQLRKGEISAYAVIPEGLMDSLVSGANDETIALMGPEGQKGLSSILMQELADIVCTLVTRSQSAVFGMQNILWSRGMSDRVPLETDILNLRLIGLVLNRTQLCRVEVTQEGPRISLEGYYFSGLLLFFLLLSGIYSCHVFSRRSRELMRLSAARGVSGGRQVLSEYVSYLCLELCCLAGVFLLAGGAGAAGFLQIPEWQEERAKAALLFFGCAVPAAALAAALQFLLYELVTGVVSGVLLQFVCAIVLGYLSGCFYPVNVFPQTLQALSQVLPTGLAMRYLCACMECGDAGAVAQAFGVLAYTAAFLGLAVLVRRRRIGR